MDSEKRTVPDERTLSADFLRTLPELKEKSREELERWAEELIELGRRTGEDYIGRNVLELCEERKIRVNMVLGGLVGKKLVRAHYDDSVKTITVYQDGITSALSTGTAECLGIGDSLEAFRTVLLWHEFFHVLEFQELGYVGERYKTEAKGLLFSKRKAVYPVSEVSANAFARTVLGLSGSPFLIDWMLHRRADGEEI